VRDNVLTLVARVNEETVSAVRVFVPWDSTFRFDIATKGERAQRVRDIERTLPGDLLAQRFLLRSFPYHQAADSENVTFEFSEKRNGRTFLLQDTTRGITKALLSREGTMSILQITGWLPTVVQTRSERTRFCRGNTVALPVTVQPGHNTIRYEILSSENQVTYRDTISAYYSIELSAHPAPPQFEKATFHTSANEAECIRCHSASAGSKKGEHQLRCNSCHAALTRQRSVHGLLAANDCTQCHETKPGSGYRTTYAPHQENMKCFGCHEDVRKELKGKQFVHAPLAGGQCSICHSPHASPQVSQLRMRVNDLCLSCHSDKNDSNHPVVFHPSEAKSDPRNPEREFTCASCHNPHASDNKNMLATAGGYFTLCQSCHKK
jgi:predicted CXXCH cytochrome family protein